MRENARGKVFGPAGGDERTEELKKIVGEMERWCYCPREGAVTYYCGYGGCETYRCTRCGGITAFHPHPRCELGGCELRELAEKLRVSKLTPEGTSLTVAEEGGDLLVGKGKKPLLRLRPSGEVEAV
jgi:hypothetical protein